MSKENKIEELNQDLLRAYGINKLYSKDVAEYLYNAGYRKQSEVAREIFEDIEKIRLEFFNNKITGADMVVKLFLLKKKYTEGEI